MKLPRRLLRRRFTSDDQTAFAKLSGDYNPLHTDPVAARRTLMGGPVVYGVHVVLVAIEAIRGVPGHQKGPSLASVSVRFPRPVLVGDTVELRLAEISNARCRMEGYVDSDLVLDLALAFGERLGRDRALVPPLSATRLHEPRFQELKGLLGSLNVGIDAALAKNLFPGFVADFGLAALAELLALTRLVGMRCPGRHSIFSQFDVTLGRSGAPGKLNFRVERTDERFLGVDMIVEGARLGGKLRAFFRPPPQAQPSIAEIATFVGQHEFERSASLIVGGSRGLGETTAKIIAAGGGLAVITYHLGAGDAARAVDEIRRWGGRCESAQLNVLRPGTLIRQLFARDRPPRTIYYFATPQIFARRRNFFSCSLFQTFLDYYVAGFSTLIDAAAEQSGRKLRIFCPSSAAIDENLREVAEYAMAKRAAEDVCAFYNRFSDKIEIIVERLPRTKTDQTSSLFEIPAEDSVKVMLPIVRRVESKDVDSLACSHSLIGAS